jgi:hypothetical protein
MMASVPNRSGNRHEHDAGHSKDGLSGLVGAGASKVGIDGALRARDVARPSAEDLAAAERDLVIRHAATRIDSRPLPPGVTPAPVPADRAGKPRQQPEPRRPHKSGQPPADDAGKGGSEPDRS